MLKSKSVTVFLLGLLAATILYSVVTLQGQDQQNAGGRKQRVGPPSEQEINDFRNQFPTVDFDAPGSSDPKRGAKNRRHNKGGLVSREPAADITGTTAVVEGTFDMPALPVGLSSAVVKGEVLDAKAHLSEDKTNIYSEFTVRVDKVLKRDGSNTIESGGAIAVERVGGNVRYPNGQKLVYRIAGMNAPRAGRSYVLFLKTASEDGDYSLLTGYELNPQGVIPLDDSRQFEIYRGYSEASFLKAIQEALAGLSPTSN
ncbi:MAG: hypothetical protein JOZ02_11320 [Acidobacteria bacterium]|nr:hypothetical protein [Acidobacteriota bacterium]